MIIFFFFLIYICSIGDRVCERVYKNMSILDHGDKMVLKMFMPARKLSILLSVKSRKIRQYALET